MLHAAYSVQDNVEDVKDIKTGHNRFLQISLSLFDYCQRRWRCMCMNYNVDPNTKTSNYSKVWFKALIYFELQKSLN